MKLIKNIAIVTFGFLFAMIILGLIVAPSKSDAGQAKYNQLQQSTEVQTQQDVPRVKQIEKVKEVPTVIEVDALQYEADYDANEVMADEKYKNKFLSVTGRVESINKGFDDGIYVMLETSFLKGVHAQIGRMAAGQAAHLRKGQTISLTCIGGGKVLTSPIIKDCLIQ